MKQLKAHYHNLTEECFGKVTMRRSILWHSEFILVSDDLNRVPSGYRLVISTKDLPNPNQKQFACVNDISLFNEGDVVYFNASGEFCWLYDITAVSNSIFVTERCNHRCIMCPQPPVNNSMDRTDFNLDLITLFSKKTREVGITGGEPTIIGDDLFKIIRQIKKNCPKACISLLSNGVKFSDIDYVAKLVECRHPDIQIDVPIFSDIASEHNRIVGAKTFYKTIQGLYNLALFEQQIGLRVVIHKQTYKRLPQLSDYIYHNFPFVRQVAFMQMEIIGYAEQNLNDLWIDPYDYNEELSEAVRFLDNRDIKTLIYNAQLCVLSENLHRFAVQSISEWKNIYLPECEQCKLKSKCGGLFVANKKYCSKHIVAKKQQNNISK